MSAIISRPTRQKEPKMQKSMFQKKLPLISESLYLGMKIDRKQDSSKSFFSQNNIESSDLLAIHDLYDQDDDEEKVNR